MSTGPRVEERERGGAESVIHIKARPFVATVLHCEDSVGQRMLPRDPEIGIRSDDFVSLFPFWYFLAYELRITDCVIDFFVIVSVFNYQIVVTTTVIINKLIC